jgi:hypothetical protein
MSDRLSVYTSAMAETSKSVLRYRAAPPAKQKRVTVLFRLILLIPHLIITSLLLGAAEVGAFFGWFVAIFTGRNPFQKFIVGVLGWYARVASYGVFLTGAYPPFSLDEDLEYPIQVQLTQGKLGRVSVLFRFFLAIPAFVVYYVVTAGLEVASIVAWLVTLIRGTLPDSMHNAFEATVRFNLRFQAYILLAQNPYPRGLFGDSKKSLVNETPQTLDESLPNSATGVADELDAVTVADFTIADASRSDLLASAPESTATFDEGSGSDASHPTTLEEPEESGDRSVGVADEPVWPIRLTRGGRLVLIGMLIVGLAGLSLYFTFVASRFNNENKGLVWSIEYRGDIASISQAVTKAQPDFEASPPNWHAITVDCAKIQTSLSSLAQVRQYPVAGPNMNLLNGANEIAVATQTCVQTVAPKLEGQQLAAMAKSFASGSYQLRVFLNKIPAVF